MGLDIRGSVAQIDPLAFIHDDAAEPAGAADDFEKRTNAGLDYSRPKPIEEFAAAQINAGELQRSGGPCA